MNYNFLKFLVLLFLPFSLFSQNDSIKKTPILYGELTYGITRDFNDGVKFLVGGEFNYQYKNHLFSFRYVENTEAKSFLIFVPIVLNKSQEYAGLYGKRWIEDGTSYSFSVGLSTNKYSVIENDEVISSYKYFGVPYEANIKWFKSHKKRYRIYGLFPVGKPTSFGRSFGIKLVGNFSKRSYVGIGLVYGLGIHKQY